MPRDQNGVYSLPAGYKAVTGQKVLASQHNGPMEDLAASMTNSLPRTGVAPMTAALQMGGNPITGVADGSTNTDAATFGQIGSALGANAGVAPEKTTPVDDDYTPLYDSAASNALRKLKWSSIKATLKTYLDTIYAPVAFVADLASTTASKGASLVGVQDSAGKIVATTVEGALAELAAFKPGFATAWAYVTVASSTPTLVNAYGISSITRNAAGNYTITFSSARANTHYVVTGILGTSSAEKAAWSVKIYDRTTTTCSFYITFGGGGTSGFFDAPEINIVVFGP